MGSDPFGTASSSESPFGNTADPFGTGASPPGENADPFGATGAGLLPAEPSSGFGVAPGTTGKPANDPSGLTGPDADPIVRMLQEDPPVTPEDMAQGLTWLSRIKRWDELKRQLDRIAAAKWNADQLATLSRAAGASLWIRIRGEEVELSEAQQALVREIALAPGKQSRDPAWLDRWIDRLADSSAGSRRLAQLRLQDGGREAINRLIERLIAGDPKVSPIMLAGTIVEFGRDGVEALRAACFLSDPEQVGRVLQVLPQIPGKHFSVEVGAALFSRNVPTTTRENLRDQVASRFGKVPTETSVATYISSQFARELVRYQQLRVPTELDLDVVCRPTSDGQAIQFVQASAAERQLERLAQLSAWKLQLPNISAQELVECGAVQLQRTYRLDSELSPVETGNRFLTEVPSLPAAESWYWIKAFEQTTEWQMHGGAIRALQILSSLEEPSREVLDFLSQRLGDARPVIRYAALEAVASLDPQQPFVGAAKAIDVAVEMTSLSGGPHALVIGLQSDADVTTANSARGALIALNSVAPVEFIVLVDRVADQSIYELLQRLRGSQRGSALPIAVLTDSLYAHERTLIDDLPGVVHSVLSKNTDQMARVVSRLIASLDIAPLTAGDRAHFAALAANFLSRVAGDRQRYDFYPIAQWHSHLVTLENGLSVESQINLLAGLGTAESQRLLVRMSSNVNFEEHDRWQAAQAFGRSVRTSGLNLGREDVLRAYDLYNLLGPKDPASARSIGLTLDVVEAHAGKIAWPEGL
jgi:hypothetical protein